MCWSASSWGTVAPVGPRKPRKNADHLPLYRQAQIYSRQGVAIVARTNCAPMASLDRSTLAGWIGKAAYELRPVFDALIAEEGLKQIAALYRIEKDIRDLAAEARLAPWQERSVPLIAAFEARVKAHRARVSTKAPLGEALRYIAKYWSGLVLFLDDGCIEMDSNAAERTIRPIALNRRRRKLALVIWT